MLSFQRVVSHVLILIFALVVPTSTAQDPLFVDGAAEDIAESRRELRTLIRNVYREKSLDAQYQLYASAADSLDELGPLLSADDAAAIRRHLYAAFQRLQLPNEVRNSHGMRFRRVVQGADVQYLSGALTEGMYVAYLNDRAIPPEKLNKLLPQPTHDISFEGVFSSPTPRLSLRGLTYYGVVGYHGWMDKTSAYHLPSADLLQRLEKVTCWASDKYEIKDHRRSDAVNMFGGKFRTIVTTGDVAGELPEATHPKLTTHYVTSVAHAKKLYLQELAEVTE